MARYVTYNSIFDPNVWNMRFVLSIKRFNRISLTDGIILYAGKLQKLLVHVGITVTIFSSWSKPWIALVSFSSDILALSYIHALNTVFLCSWSEIYNLIYCYNVIGHPDQGVIKLSSEVRKFLGGIQNVFHQSPLWLLIALTSHNYNFNHISPTANSWNGYILFY